MIKYEQSVYEFPSAKKIIELVPQIIIAHDALDHFGNPISLEEFSFDPEAVLTLVKKEEYEKFMMYMLEYKILVLEQMSHEREKLNLETMQQTKENEGYGVILACTTIRDFNGFGIGHMVSLSIMPKESIQLFSLCLGYLRENRSEP